MKKFAVLTITAVLMSVFGVACGGKKKDSSADVTAARVNDPRLSGGPVSYPTGQSMGQATGSIRANSDQEMTNAVKSFASAFINPEFVGNTSAQNGVVFNGRVQWDNYGKIVGESYIQIVMSDEYTGTVHNGQTVRPLRVMVPAVGVNFTSQTSARITFQDSYGMIVMEGNWSSGTFVGTVSFQNSQAVSGNPAQGTLGQFQIVPCGFIVCGNGY